MIGKRACETQRMYTYTHNRKNTTHVPIPVATLRANEAKGSGCSSLSSRVKLFTSALGRSAPGRRPCLAGSPPGVYCVVGCDHWMDPSSTHAIASLNPRHIPLMYVAFQSHTTVWPMRVPPSSTNRTGVSVKRRFSHDATRACAAASVTCIWYGMEGRRERRHARGDWLVHWSTG